MSKESEHVNIFARLWYFSSQWFFLAFLVNLFTFGLLTPIVAGAIVIDFALGFIILANDGYNSYRLACSPLLTVWWSLFNPNFGLYWACRYIATPFTAFSGGYDYIQKDYSDQFKD